MGLSRGAYVMGELVCKVLTMPSLTPLLWLRVVFLPGGSVFCFLAAVVVVVVVVVVVAVRDF